MLYTEHQGRAETFGGAGALKYKRGTWNMAFIRAMLLADMCINIDVSVLIQQQIAWYRFKKETQNRKDHFKFAPLNDSGIILLLLLSLQGMVVLLFLNTTVVVVEINMPVLFQIEFYSNPVLNLFIF